MRMSEMRKMGEKDLKEKIQELHVNLGKMRMSSTKGTLRKDSGKIRPIKRDIARMLTLLGEASRK